MSHSITRKPIGRKPISGAANGPVVSHVIGIAAEDADSTKDRGITRSISATLPQQKPATHALDDTGALRRVNSDSSTPMHNGSPHASAIYTSLVSIASPQQMSSGMQSVQQTQPQYHTPSPGQLVQVKSFDSTLSTSSVASGWSANPSTVASYQTGQTSPMSSISLSSGHRVSAYGLPDLTRSMSESSSVSSPPSLPICHHCRIAIPTTVSAFVCLICSTGSSSTQFCVYCFTTGVAAASHSQHDQSYYVTESDPTVKPDQKANGEPADGPAIPSHIWAVRKNAAGRLWYEHRSTKFRTHIPPLTAVIPASGLPPGWEMRINPDGKKYYFNATTGLSLWTPPLNAPLPSGWKEVRTPDGKPFYVCDSLQLATWDRPGDQPKATTEKPRLANTTGGVDGQTATTQSEGSKKDEPKNKKSSKVGGKSSAVHGVAAAGAAVSLAGTIMQLSDAADLSPQGILSATKAAAKLTTHGAKFAGKKMKLGKLVKSSKWRRASTLINTASALTGDGDDEDDGDYGSDEDDGDGSEGEETVVDHGDGCEEQQTPYEPQYTAYPPMEPVYEQPLIGSTYISATDIPAQSSVIEDSTQYLPSEQPAVVVNNVYVNETVVVNETSIEQNDLEINETVQNSVQADETVQNNVQVNEIVQNNVEVSETVNSYQEFNYVSPTEATQPPLDYLAPYGAGLPPTGIPDTCPPSGYEAGMQQPPLGSTPAMPPAQFLPPGGPSEPFVFNPVLAGPMMVNPPPEQNGVVFAPTYV